MKKLFTICSALILVTSLSAQKVISKKGDLDFLKGEKVVNIKYDYSEMKVGKFNSEQEYVDEKVAEHNEKEAGKGDEWKQGWENAKETRYATKFEELFNKGLEKDGLKGHQEAEDAKYTLIVKTTFIEPGFNVGVMKRPASANFEYVFVESADESKVVAVYTQSGVPGSQMMGYDFDAGSRIAESYAKGAKSLAATIHKAIK